MKVTTLRMLVGVTTPLILTGSVQAGFLGISTVSKPNPWGILTVNVYAEFDRPGEDHMIAVAKTPGAPLNITVVGGTFYNHALGGDQAPNAAFFPAFPSLAYDTFVTIGVKCIGDPPCQPVDTLTITPGFPAGITGSSLAGDFGWAITPTATQGDPFNPPFSFPGDGQILIGQFSTADGSAIQGTMLLSYVSNGNNIDAVHTFFVPAPGGLPAVVLFCALGARRRRRG